jgi:hypothetical protein
MADRAQVTSVEAIASFRANLILYLSKARPTVEEVSNEVLRTRAWLQHDRRRHWEHELRLRHRRWEEAQQELFSAMLSRLASVKSEQQRAVHEAKRALDEAEDKLAVLKKWDRELENRCAPLLKLVDQLHGFLTSDLAKAVAYLADVVKTLDAYAGVRLPGGAAAPADPADAAADVPAEGSPPTSEGRTGNEEEKVP